MLTVYDLVDFDGSLLATHLDHDRALHHLDHARKYDRAGENCRLVPRQTDTLFHEPIYAGGDVLGHQFRMDGYGGQTFWRKIQNIRVSHLGHIMGEAIILGRVVLVEYDYYAWLDCRKSSSCSARWRATQMQGWSGN